MSLLIIKCHKHGSCLLGNAELAVDSLAVCSLHAYHVDALTEAQLLRLAANALHELAVNCVYSRTLHTVGERDDTAVAVVVECAAYNLCRACLLYTSPSPRD